MIFDPQPFAVLHGIPALCALIFTHSVVSYLPPILVGSYAPETDQSGTSPHVRYISSGHYIKIFQKFSMAKYGFCSIFESHPQRYLT